MDFWLSTNNGHRWSITARGSGESYKLAIWNVAAA